LPGIKIIIILKKHKPVTDSRYSDVKILLRFEPAVGLHCDLLIAVCPPVGTGSSEIGSAHRRALAPPKVFTPPKLHWKMCQLCLRVWGNNSSKLKSPRLAPATHVYRR